MAKKKSEKSGLNKKLLSKMTEQAMPEKPKPRLSLYGEDAKQFFDSKPGTQVSAKIKGVVQSVGMSEWNKNEPNCDIRITSISSERKGKGE